MSSAKRKRSSSPENIDELNACKKPAATINNGAGVVIQKPQIAVSTRRDKSTASGEFTTYASSFSSPSSSSSCSGTGPHSVTSSALPIPNVFSENPIRAVSSPGFAASLKNVQPVPVALQDDESRNASKLAADNLKPIPAAPPSLKPSAPPRPRQNETMSTDALPSHDAPPVKQISYPPIYQDTKISPKHHKSDEDRAWKIDKATQTSSPDPTTFSIPEALRINSSSEDEDWTSQPPNEIENDSIRPYLNQVLSFFAKRTRRKRSEFHNWLKDQRTPFPPSSSTAS